MIVTILVNNKYHNNWGKLWSSKIDYIENQQNIIASNPIIHLSVDYFIGLTENAISIVNNYNNGESVFTLSTINVFAFRKLFTLF